MTANGTTTTNLQITVADAQNNPITGQAVTFSSTGTNFTFGATTCSTTAGTCSVTLKSTLAQTVTVTAAFAGLTKTAAVTFVAGAPSSSTSTLTAAPGSLEDNNTATTTLQITVEDANNNPIGSQAVTFSSTGTGYAFSATTCTTATSGICSVTLKSSVAETVTVTASFASATKTASVTFVTGLPASGTSTFTASPNTLLDDGVTTTTLQVSVNDATNNPVTGQAVTFSSTGTSYTFSSTTCTTSAGVCSVTLKSTLTQTITVTAAFAGITKTQTIAIYPGAAATLSVTGIPGAVNVGQSNTATVQALDASGNVATGYLGVVTFTSSDGAAVLPGKYTFLATDNGSKTFSGIVFETAGTQSLAATDTANGSITGSETGIVVSASSLAVSSVASFPAQSFHCAVMDGNVKCWGFDYDYNLGYGDQTTRGASPNQMGPQLPNLNLGTGRTARAVSVGDDQGCALLDTNQVACWGGNYYDESGGGGGPVVVFSPTVVPFSGSRTAVGVSAGYEHTCAVFDTRAVGCWGSGYTGYGDTTTRGPPVTGTINLGTNRTALQLTAGFNFDCALLDNRSVACWGGNGKGQLGVGDTNTRLAPVAVNLGTGRTAHSIAAGYSHTCAVLDTNQITCWGGNPDGEQGFGDTLQRNAPANANINLGAGRTAVSVSCGTDLTCALLDDATVKCWGSGVAGGLGIGTTVNSYAPTTAITFTGSASALGVSVGPSSGCALLATQQIQCWGGESGGDTDGVLGLGDTLNRGDTSADLPASYGITPLW